MVRCYDLAIFWKQNISGRGDINCRILKEKKKKAQCVPGREIRSVEPKTNEKELWILYPMLCPCPGEASWCSPENREQSYD